MKHCFSRWLYPFLGIHSFLIGLFPFFFPVYLWKNGFDLSTISFGIGVSGAGFILCLYIWDRIHKRLQFSHLLFPSFFLEIFFFASLFFLDYTWGIWMSTLLYGSYNCFFWMMQRSMFFETVSPENSGKKFGNFQIFVFLILKIGIFTGGFLLESYGLSSLFLLSIVVSCVSFCVFFAKSNQAVLPKVMLEEEPLTAKKIVNFSDSHGSKFTFLLDGPFLFFESFYWTISLFFVTFESFFQLGILVILLSVLFGGFFLMIKNFIDVCPQRRVYVFGVGIYSLSWFMRASLDIFSSQIAMGICILLLTFATSLFRLTFNKQFFDIAYMSHAHQYIFLKSYYSQFSVIVIFFVLGGIFSFEYITLPILYAIAGVSALGFLAYKKEP